MMGNANAQAGRTAPLLEGQGRLIMSVFYVKRCQSCGHVMRFDDSLFADDADACELCGGALGRRATEEEPDPQAPKDGSSSVPSLIDDSETEAPEGVGAQADEEKVPIILALFDPESGIEIPLLPRGGNVIGRVMRECPFPDIATISRKQFSFSYGTDEPASVNVVNMSRYGTTVQTARMEKSLQVGESAVIRPGDGLVMGGFHFQVIRREELR